MTHVEYCSPLWHPSKIEDIDAVKGIQLFFTAKIKESHSYWGWLKNPQLMSLQHRRELFILLNIWKILHNKIPNDLEVSFRPPKWLSFILSFFQTTFIFFIPNDIGFEPSFQVFQGVAVQRTSPYPSLLWNWGFGIFYRVPWVWLIEKHHSRVS